MKNYDELEIRKTIALMSNGLIEVRIIGTNLMASGYFKDVDVLLKNLKQYENKQGLNFYFVMNAINEGCYSRQQRDCFIEKSKLPTTSDKDIVKRKWLLIDIDCERPTGVSSSNEELQKSKDKANQIYSYLKSEGFEQPIVALSGSGTHLLYKIDLDNDKEPLIKNCLLSLDLLFSDEFIKIDTSVFNASRITKLYGTIAAKGKNTEERPHRLSRIVKFPEEIKVNDIVLLVKLAKNLPEPPKRLSYQKNEFNIDEWLSKYNIRIKNQLPFNGGRKLILEECSFNENHKGKDAAIFEMNNGAIGFKCFHSSCSQYTWQDVRKKFEPNAYEYQSYERITPRINSQKKSIEKSNDETIFFTAPDIKVKDRSHIVSIPTGIKKLDKKIIGLNKGEITCISGVRGSGKSSLLSQWALQAVDKQYKVAMFSGELKETRVLEWLQLQAAGKQFTHGTECEDYFYVDNITKDKINEWLGKKLYIYNNNHGNDIQKILDSLEHCIKANKVDLVILDNLMSLSLDNIAGDKYEKQKNLVLGLHNFAEDNDIAILFVMHPRKALGFIRIEDISGDAALTNASDNVFIVHRVNTDFKNKSKLEFNWKEDNEIYTYSNVIEVCKNRDLGVQDYFVGMHYEKESKRFLNEKFETKHYGWEDTSTIKDIDIPEGFSLVDGIVPPWDIE